MADREQANDDAAFMSVKDAARRLSLSEVTIRRFLTLGRLRRYKVGGRTLVATKDVMGLVKPQPR